MKENIEAFFVCCLCVAAFAFGAVSGCKQERTEAIKAGVAEYYIDADNDKAFRWKTNLFEFEIKRQVDKGARL